VGKSFIIKGDICHSSSVNKIETADKSFLLCLDGKCGGIFGEIPRNYSHLPVMDYSGKLIIPGLTDLHIHAPQFAFQALGMDMELLDWLNIHTFPEEAKYSDPVYTREAYSHFVEHVKKGPNTRLCVFATIHVEGTLLLSDLLEESGLVSLVGKVSMDRNCPKNLSESDACAAEQKWLHLFFKKMKEGTYNNTAPIITPRFIPSCSDKLMKELSHIQKNYGLPVQSHLSENRKEVEWVKELCPGCGSYAAAYEDSGFMDSDVPAIMAHCVWLEESEKELLAANGIYIAHCPQSNMNLSSGIAPVKSFLKKGIKVGLGSDVAGGVHSSIFRAMTDAIQVSKLRHALIAPEEKPLTLDEAFYLGTAGGGSFFGKLAAADSDDTEKVKPSFGATGSFREGLDFDALVIDDSSLSFRTDLSLRERLEKVVYLSDDRHIKQKFVRGEIV
jgi:guanine deaminase